MKEGSNKSIGVGVRYVSVRSSIVYQNYDIHSGLKLVYSLILSLIIPTFLTPIHQDIMRSTFDKLGLEMFVRIIKTFMVC